MSSDFIRGASFSPAREIRDSRDGRSAGHAETALERGRRLLWWGVADHSHELPKWAARLLEEFHAADRHAAAVAGDLTPDQLNWRRADSAWRSSEPWSESGLGKNGLGLLRRLIMLGLAVAALGGQATA